MNILDLAADQQIPATGAIEIFVTVLLFAVVLLCALGGAVRVAAGFRLPTTFARSRAEVIANASRQERSNPQTRMPANDNREEIRSSSTTERVGQVPIRESSSRIEPGRKIVIHDRPGEEGRQKFEPLGKSHRPRLNTRTSFSARRRDHIP